MSLLREKVIRIKKLRRRGHSIPEISKSCDVSRSTALRYAKNVKILPQYYDRWLARRNASKIISQRNWEIASQQAMSLITNLNNKELALIAAVLYWAEGAKKDLSFSNTDPGMIKVFIKILKEIFGIRNADLKISLRIYEDLNKIKCLNYWSKATGIKLNLNTSVNVLRGSKIGKLQYGMCRVRVKKGGLLLKKLFSIINRVELLT